MPMATVLSPTKHAGGKQMGEMVLVYLTGDSSVKMATSFSYEFYESFKILENKLSKTNNHSPLSSNHSWREF